MDASSASQQVSNLSVFFIIASIIVCAGALLGFSIWGKRKYRILFSFISMFAGAAGYFTSQLLRGGLLQLGGWAEQLQAYPWLLAAAVALVTAVTAEFTRFVIFMLMKDRRDFPDGLAYGIGHGGTELILGAGLTLVTYYMFASSINSGTWSSIIEGLASEPQTQTLYIQYGQMMVKSAPVDFLVFGLDGLCKVLVQIALSLIVVTGFMMNKKWQYLAVAIIIDMLVSVIYIVPQIFTINQWIAESFVLVLAAAAVWYIAKTGREWSRKDVNKNEQPKLPDQADIP
jgi:uncharacterized membrane protein YhfC